MKKVITILLLGVIFLVGCGEKVSKSDVVYDIASIDDISIGDVKRYSYRVVIPDTTDEKDIRSVIDEIIGIAKEDTPFNALNIFMYSSESLVEDAYDLAMAELVPYGEWGRASEVRTGKYNKMKLNIDIYSKDGVEKPTEEEFKIYGEFMNKLNSENEKIIAENPTSFEMADEDAIAEIVASEFDISKEEVNEIVMDVIIYANTK